MYAGVECVEAVAENGTCRNCQSSKNIGPLTAFLALGAALAALLRLAFPDS
jgi:hypothetical protein